MSERVGICPKCFGEFGADNETCPDDGAKLVLTEPGASSRVGQTIDDKFTILGHLGTGGMGSVYRALQHSMEREVALKLLKRALSEDKVIVRRFLQEAKGASKLNHPNVITLFDFGQTNDGELYIVMELLTGEGLHAVLKRHKRLTMARSIAIMCQVCDALQAAHEAGVIHRDLKPDNVYVIKGAGQTGEFVKVLDFGIAKVLESEQNSQLTQTGSVCGTPAYMSPEQAMGHPVDARSDIYSAGILLYELLSGNQPFTAETPVALMMAQVRDEPPRLAEALPELQIPAEMDSLLQRTLSKEPDKRPQSATEFKQCLIRLLAGMETAASPTDVDKLSFIDTQVGEAVEPPFESEYEPTPKDTEQSATPSTTELINATARSKKLPWVLVGVLLLAIVGIVAYQAGGNAEKIKGNGDSKNDRPAISKVVAVVPAAPVAEKEGAALPVKSEKVETGEASAAPSKEAAAVDSSTDNKESEADEAKSLNVRVISVPAGATIYDTSGSQLSKAPFILTRPADGTEANFVLKLDGYVSAEVTVTPGCPDDRVVFLQKEAPAKKVTKSKKTKKRPASKRRKSKKVRPLIVE
jgi:serine/threonine protein kinase